MLSCYICIPCSSASLGVRGGLNEMPPTITASEYVALNRIPVWVGLGGVALREEICHLGVGFGVLKGVCPPFSLSLSVSCLLSKT